MIKLTLAIVLMSLSALADSIVLTPENTVVYRGEVSNTSANKMQKAIHGLVTKRGSKTYKIYLVLDSPGGSISAGDAFIQYAKTVPNLDTVTVFAASMAAGIVEALPGNRYITENGILMFHRASGQIGGQFEKGEMESRLAFFKQMVLSMEIKNASRLKMSLADYKKEVVNEMWMYGYQATARKAADKVVDIKCSSELIDKSVLDSFLFMGMFEIQIKYSGCPLFSGAEIVDNKKDERVNQAFREYIQTLRTPIAK